MVSTVNVRGNDAYYFFTTFYYLLLLFYTNFFHFILNMI